MAFEMLASYNKVTSCEPEIGRGIFRFEEEKKTIAEGHLKLSENCSLDMTRGL
jgi:hypothetical protein